jgi:hypothetical protein
MERTGRPHASNDRDLVLDYRSTARVESRQNRRLKANSEYEFRIVYEPPSGQRADLGLWCGSEERAWASACLRLGLRLPPAHTPR